MSKPLFSVLQAAIQPNPYPYYSALLQGPWLPFDPDSGCYLASRAAVITDILQHPAARVRPVTQPVPAALQGHRCGAVFAALLRMTDGPQQQQLKAILQRQLAAVAPAQLTDMCLVVLSEATEPKLADATQLNKLIYQLPVRVMAQILGMQPAAARAAATAIADFVRCLPAQANEMDIHAADAAALQLQALIHDCLQDPASWSAALAAEFGAAAVQVAAANLLGLLSQSYEATAGLIANSLIRCVLQPELAPQDPLQALLFVREVSRFDPPVQNTRRFLAEDAVIAGQHLPAGATILLLLAAAGRDPQQWSAPEQFRPYDRLCHSKGQTDLSFSLGAHQCPGRQLAEQIAATTLSVLWPQLRDCSQSAELRWIYQPSVNGRLAWFHFDQGVA
ncbi:MAG: cytochrome P450 [Rheinheimera sp.]|nr:cytochrome P450 [Rheinheimera sp.]